MWWRDLARRADRTGARVARAANGGTVALVLITGIVAVWVVLALASVATWVGVNPVGGSANDVVATVDREEVAFGPAVVSTSTSTTLRRAVSTTATAEDLGSSVAETGADRTIVVPAVPQTLPERVVAATIPPATATPVAPTTASPATAPPTAPPTTAAPTTPPPTTAAPTTAAPATVAPTTAPTTAQDSTTAPPTAAPTTARDTTTPPTTETTTTVATTTTEAPSTTTTTTTGNEDDDDFLDRWCSFFPRSRWCA